jgi:hypothetical protein
MTCFSRHKLLFRAFYLPVCFFFRVILMLPPLNEALGVEVPVYARLVALLGLDAPLGLDALFGLDAPFGLDAAPLGLDALRGIVTRRNKQNREMEDTVIDPGSTYLTLLVRLNNLLNLLGRFLEHSTASKLVTGL